MATLQQLQTMKGDADTRKAAVASERAKVAALVDAVAALPVSKRDPSSRTTQRLLADRAAHVAYQQMLLDVQARSLAAEIARVQLGGQSAVPVPTLSTDTGERKGVQPVQKGRG